MSNKNPRKKGKKNLSKKDLTVYNALLKRVQRAKDAIKKDNKKINYGNDRGKRNNARSDRSKQYSKLTEANSALLNFREKHGIGKPKGKKKKQKGRVDVKKHVIYFKSMYAFQFEKEKLTDFIRSGSVKKYIFIYKGMRKEITRTSPKSSIFSLYDYVRNATYLDRFSESDLIVNAQLDKDTMTLTVYFQA